MIDPLPLQISYFFFLYGCWSELRFGVVLMDEASQVIEPVSLLPLAMSKAEKLLLVSTITWTCDSVKSTFGRLFYKIFEYLLQYLNILVFFFPISIGHLRQIGDNRQLPPPVQITKKLPAPAEEKDQYALDQPLLQRLVNLCPSIQLRTQYRYNG